MILKKVIVELTQEEITSPEDIQIELVVQEKENPEENITYTISYPKS